ncbi:MAG TPA: DUF4296 domain-containing protein [Chitinophagaceae bacterium]|jgi:hypothetical protein|nr:DUF4296 domain-containing protein [Chitinophagaceae bacterium]
MTRILIGALLLTLFSCSDQKPATPKGVLPVEKMGPLIWDAMRADELVTQNHTQRRDSSFDLDAYRFGLYNEVFRIHGTSRAQFDSSLKYYQMHPDLMKTVLDGVQQQAEKATAVKPADSTRKKDSSILGGKKVM